MIKYFRNILHTLTISYNPNSLAGMLSAKKKLTQDEKEQVAPC